MAEERTVVMNIASKEKDESFMVQIADGFITSSHRINNESGMSSDKTGESAEECEVITDPGENLLSLVTEACRLSESSNGVTSSGGKNTKCVISPIADDHISYIKEPHHVLSSKQSSTDVEENIGHYGNCLWTQKGALMLIELHTLHKSMFSDSNYKKKTVWEMVARQMRERGYNYTWNQVESKWKSMTKKFRDTVDHNEKHGHLVPHTCSYFEALAAVYNYKPDVVAMTLASRSSDSSCSKIVTRGKGFSLGKRSADDVDTGEWGEEETDGAAEAQLRRKKKISNGSSERGAVDASDQSTERNAELFRFLKNLHNDKKRHDMAKLAKIESMHNEKMAVFRSFLDTFKEYVNKLK